MKKGAIKHPRHTNKSEAPPYKNSNFNKLEVEKMANVVLMIFSKCIFIKENQFILMQISLTFVSKDSNDNKSPLIQIEAWHQTGDKPLSQPMMAYITDTYMLLSASRS